MACVVAVDFFAAASYATPLLAPARQPWTLPGVKEALGVASLSSPIDAFGRSTLDRMKTVHTVRHLRSPLSDYHLDSCHARTAFLA